MSCCRTLSPELGVVSVPDYGHSNGCVVISHCFAILIFIFWLHHTACGIRGPRPGIEPVSPALAAQVLNHWTTMEVPLFFFLKVYLFIYFWLSQVFIAASRPSLDAESGGYSLTAVHGLLIAVAALSGERKLQGTWASEVAAPRLQSTGSIVVGHQLSRSVAFGIFLN